MNALAHLAPEAARLLQADIDARMAFIKQLPFVAYPAGVKALEWLSYLRRFEYGRDRPRNLHIVGVGGIGKSRLLSHYASQHGPMPRGDDGRRPRPVLLVEAPENGELKQLSDNFLAACLAGMTPRRRGSYVGRIEPILQITGVQQVLIDEAGNLLLAGKSRQQQCLAFIKRITNLGITVAIATTENMKMVLAADEQLYSRFKQIGLPKWQESNELRGFLASVEVWIPLPRPSHLDSLEMIRWLVAQQCLRTGSMLEVIRDAAHIAFREDLPNLSVPLLQRALEATGPPDGRREP